jgi:hypothetical protein
MERFNDVTPEYLEKLTTPNGYNFLLCSFCQAVRTNPFAIYRITPAAPAETFILIGMSIALEWQFGYKIPKLLLAKDITYIPSLLAGYEVVITKNDLERRNRLQQFLPQVIQKVRETSWKPETLPFEVFTPSTISGQKAELEHLVLDAERSSELENLQKTYDFLISYHSSDDPWATWIAYQLEQAGHSVMKKESQLYPNMEQFLLDALRDAENIILLLSPTYLNWSGAIQIAKILRNMSGSEIRKVKLVQVSGGRRIVGSEVTKLVSFASLVNLTEVVAVERLAEILNLEVKPSQTRIVSSLNTQRYFPGISTPSLASRKPISIFCSYSHKDEAMLNQLQMQLAGLVRQGVINLWHDRNINASTEWKSAIDQHLNTAQIILLLVSPDFVASKYCYSIEMKRAMERHERGEAYVIPIILRSTLWQDAPFGKLQALPADAVPVTSRKWHTQEEAFYNIAEGIRIIVEEAILGLEINN